MAHYLARVLRLRAGDAFVAFDPATGRESDGVTLGSGAAGVTVRFGPLRDGARPPERELILVQGMAKGDKCDGVVRDATELGATRSHRRDDPAHGREARRVPRRRAAGAVGADRARGRAAVRPEPGSARRRPVPVERRRSASCPSRPRDSASGSRPTDPLAPALLHALAERVPLAFACGPEGGLEEGEVQRARDLAGRDLARSLRAAHGDRRRRGARRRPRLERAGGRPVSRSASRAWRVAREPRRRGDRGPRGRLRSGSTRLLKSIVSARAADRSSGERVTY